jgi:hypothetical protein
MFGFGTVLMHIADYLTRRKYDKEKRRRRRSEKEELVDKKYSIICKSLINPFVILKRTYF